MQRRLLTGYRAIILTSNKKAYDTRGRTTSTALTEYLERDSDEALSDRAEFFSLQMCDCVAPFERLSTFEFLADDPLLRRSITALESTAGASHTHDCQQWLDADDVQHTREVVAEYDVPSMSALPRDGHEVMFTQSHFSAMDCRRYHRS
jgi:hypothetical protein